MVRAGFTANDRLLVALLLLASGRMRDGVLDVVAADGGAASCRAAR